jgi:hypothetical protein
VEEAEMPERTLFKIGSASAIVGMILAIIFNILHPRASDTSAAALVPKIAASGIWRTDHLALAVAVVLATCGLVAIYRSITAGRGAALARLGFAGALVSAGVFLVLIAMDGVAMKELAQAWAGAPAAEKATAFRVAAAVGEVNAAIFFLWTFAFFGVTILLYGLAVALSDVYPKWLGWVAVLAALGSAAIAVVEIYSGPSNLWTNVLFPIFSIIISVWLLVMGVLLWRKASKAA